MPSNSIRFLVSHQEGSLQSVGRPVCCDLTFLHGLQQGSLRLRRCAVDLIGQNEIGEDRTGAESHITPSGAGEDRTGDVHRHEVGGELDPGKPLHHLGERAGDERLRLGDVSIRRARQPGIATRSSSSTARFPITARSTSSMARVRGSVFTAAASDWVATAPAPPPTARSGPGGTELGSDLGSWVGPINAQASAPSNAAAFSGCCSADAVTGGKPVGGQPAQERQQAMLGFETSGGKGHRQTGQRGRRGALRQLPVLAVSWARSGNRRHPPPPRHSGPPATTRRPALRRPHPAKAERQPRRARRARKTITQVNSAAPQPAPIRPALPRRRSRRWSPGATQTGRPRRPGSREPGGGAGAEPRRDPGRILTRRLKVAAPIRHRPGSAPWRRRHATRPNRGHRPVASRLAPRLHARRRRRWPAPVACCCGASPRQSGHGEGGERHSRDQDRHPPQRPDGPAVPRGGPAPPPGLTTSESVGTMAESTSLMRSIGPKMISAAMTSRAAMVTRGDVRRRRDGAPDRRGRR